MATRRSSIRAALRTNRELGKLFAKLGTSEHPRGAVLVAYRNARRAMRDVAGRKSPYAANEAREVFSGLRDSVGVAIQDTLTGAIQLGVEQAQVEAEVWGLALESPFVDTAPMAEALLGVIEQQERASLPALLLDADPALILGDDDRLGILRSNTVLGDAAHWLTAAAMLAFTGALSPAIQASDDEWGKQAIAAIDERTTPCCLGVCGQVVPFDEKFHTPRTPAYASHQDWSPFHKYCRTSITVVPMSEADDELTARLLEQAAAEEALRQEAADRIKEIMEELVELQTIPDARKRKDDNEQVRGLRDELLTLRQRGGYPTA